ncbi:hypothetical protein RvY_02975 [Ramazzottius varieornatus]|uniref:Uncharacterized protein n=1 Tax=Ramazzottius varieornatus TaxID=947166 RepID=A0A1D1ULJ2_RAMVA|nr:hypothetical protein RvY_02975 [Ramazzottius varieornatus]
MIDLSRVGIIIRLQNNFLAMNKTFKKYKTEKQRLIGTTLTSNERDDKKSQQNVQNNQKAKTIPQLAPDVTANRYNKGSLCDVIFYFQKPSSSSKSSLISSDNDRSFVVPVTSATAWFLRGALPELLILFTIWRRKGSSETCRLRVSATSGRLTGSVLASALNTE